MREFSKKVQDTRNRSRYYGFPHGVMCKTGGLIFYLWSPVDKEFRPSAAPVFGATTGSTKAGRRKRRSRGS
jgi:hypothetical protein